MNVVVIGAGVIGCAVAYELAARGARVRLLDMRGVGRGATSASAGVLCPHIEGHAAPLRQLGTASLARYDEFVARVGRDSGREIEYRRNGTLEIALTDLEAARLRDTAASHARAGVGHEYLEPHDARALEPALSEQTVGALFVPEHGYIGAAAFTAALASAARAAGAVIDESARVTGIVPDGSGIRVETEAAPISGDVVVVSAGSWSSRIAPIATPPAVKPIRGQLLHLRREPPVASRVLWGFDCYLVPWQDGSLLVGATVEDVGFDESATVAGVRDLLERACDLLPAVWNARFQAVRVGLRPATPDELPIVGRSSTHPAVFFATGHYRNGVLLAPFTATALADLILADAQAPELALTDPRRFAL